ncbi:MAG: hypothetical protein JO142_02765 [Burkholderiales bacterium]|nr:hypothetical protein [Burkholderiales bacterium]
MAMSAGAGATALGYWLHRLLQPLPCKHLARLNWRIGPYRAQVKALDHVVMAEAASRQRTADKQATFSPMFLKGH